MVRVRYSLLTMLLWVFILAWWAGLVGWVAAAGAWPMGSLPPILWPLWMCALAMPAVTAYLSWEYLWGQEKRRRSRPRNPQIRRDKLPRAKEKEQAKAPSTRGMKGNQYLGKVTEVSEKPSPLTLAQSGIGHALNSEVPSAHLTPRALRTPAAACAAPRPASAYLSSKSSLPSIDGGDKLLDDFEEALRQLVDLDQRG